MSRLYNFEISLENLPDTGSDNYQAIIDILDEEFVPNGVESWSADISLFDLNNLYERIKEIDSNVKILANFFESHKNVKKNKYSVYYSYCVVVEADNEDQAVNIAEKEIFEAEPNEIVNGLEFSDCMEIE